MRVLGILAFAFMTLACSSYSVPNTPVTSDMGKVVSAEHLEPLCSRPGPGEVEGTWTPDEKVIAQLEARLPRVRRMRAELCCLTGRWVKDVGAYYRQYFGVVVDGKRWVYVNAFNDAFPPVDWDRRMVDSCDGGDIAWGILYDPVTGRFHDLAVNGVAS